MSAIPTTNDNATTQAKFWASLVANVGFPILVAGYLLIKITSTLDRINETLARQQAMLDALSRVLEKLQ